MERKEILLIQTTYEMLRWSMVKFETGKAAAKGNAAQESDTRNAE